MTIDEFFTLLERTRRNWRVLRNGVIRQDDNDACPITAVAWADDGGRSAIIWEMGRVKLGLRAHDALKIVRAADGQGRLRRRLLKACGL